MRNFKIEKNANKIIQSCTDLSMEITLEMLELRDSYRKEFGFAYLTETWIYPLAEMLKGQKILEVMAGSGSLSRALLEQDCEVIATDDLSWKNYWKDTWMDVENLSANEAIAKYNDVDYIIMSWPPYDKPSAYQTLMSMRKHNPNAKIIYIGEDHDGCTGDENFHDSVEWLDNEIIENINQEYQSFLGMHDYIQLCK